MAVTVHGPYGQLGHQFSHGHLLLQFGCLYLHIQQTELQGARNIWSQDLLGGRKVIHGAQQFCRGQILVPVMIADVRKKVHLGKGQAAFQQTLSGFQFAFAQTELEKVGLQGQARFYGSRKVFFQGREQAGRLVQDGAFLLQRHHAPILAFHRVPQGGTGKGILQDGGIHAQPGKTVAVDDAAAGIKRLYHGYRTAPTALETVEIGFDAVLVGQVRYFRAQDVGGVRVT